MHTIIGNINMAKVGVSEGGLWQSCIYINTQASILLNIFAILEQDKTHHVHGDYNFI